MKDNLHLEDLVRCGLEACPDFMFARNSLRFFVTLRRHTIPCKSIKQGRMASLLPQSNLLFSPQNNPVVHSFDTLLIRYAFFTGFLVFRPLPFYGGSLLEQTD